MVKKYLIWHIQGGLGKNVAATALCSDLKKAYPDRELIVSVSWPEIWLNNPNVDRVYHMGHHPHFYEDYVHNKDTLIFRHEPYHQSGHIHRKSHLLESWCELMNIKYKKQQPQIIINYAQQGLVGMWNREKPVMILQTNGGPFTGQKLPYNWPRDMPIELAMDIANKFKNDYHILHVCRQDSVKLEGVERVDKPLSNLELFAMLGVSKKRVLIDSCLQHAAAAFKLPSTVIWIATSPKVFGYELHNNVTPKYKKKASQMIGSYLFDFQFENNLHECIYNSYNEMFDTKNIIDKI